MTDVCVLKPFFGTETCFGRTVWTIVVVGGLPVEKARGCEKTHLLCRQKKLIKIVVNRSNVSSLHGAYIWTNIPQKKLFLLLCDRRQRWGGRECTFCYWISVWNRRFCFSVGAFSLSPLRAVSPGKYNCPRKVFVSLCVSSKLGGMLFAPPVFYYSFFFGFRPGHLWDKSLGGNVQHFPARVFVLFSLPLLGFNYRTTEHQIRQTIDNILLSRVPLSLSFSFFFYFLLVSPFFTGGTGTGRTRTRGRRRRRRSRG